MQNLSPCFWLLFALAARGAVTEAPANPSLAWFTDPPAESRIIKIIHSWPDGPEQQTQLIRRLKAQGFGGVVCNDSFTEYLENEPRWQALVRAVKAAKQAGMSLWLYDEKGYPSGTAGGLVLRGHPEWEAHGLLIANTECGPGPVKLDLPPGKPFLLAAFPVRNGAIDLHGKVDLAASLSGTNLQWEAPAGRWQVMAITESALFEGTHASMSLADHIPYLNLLMAEPTRRFLEVTHQRYAEHLGANLGASFLSTFTDEPSLMSMFLRPMPYRALPWSPSFSAEFKKRRGYEIESFLPAAIVEAGPEGLKPRYDFWQTVGELVSENFFGQIQEWCHRHQILSGGHLLMEESPVTHVPLYGDFFRCIRRLDAPSIDCLTSVPAEVPWYIARLLSSAAALEGKTVVMSETSDHGQRYRGKGDNRPVRTVAEAEIRGTCNRLIVSGVNVITSYYSFADLTDAQLRRLNEWVGRCCASVKGGHQVTDIAFLYPSESLWTHFRPARNWANESPQATQVETVYRTAAESLFSAGREFTFVDSRALAEAKVDHGILIHGQLRWRLVVLPSTDTLPLAAWQNLERFVESGGIVVALGALPVNSDTEFPAPAVRALAKAWFGDVSDQPAVHRNAANGAGIFLPLGAQGLLPAVVKQVLEPDVRTTGGRPTLRSTHRRIGAQEVYLVINDSSEAWKGQISFGVEGPGEALDPATAALAPIEKGQDVPLELGAYGAMVYRFATPRLPRRFPVKDGALPNPVLTALPGVQPLLAGGEFVRAELTADPAHSTGNAQAWGVSGKLTKGQVDTFLFARLPFNEPVDLSPTDCLVIETWVPEQQQTATQLLVILQEQGGGDFLASSGRSLAAPGYNRTYLPLNQLQLAGWSKDADGLLDLRRIQEIRIGWGGYLGRQGETVQFTIRTPLTAQ